MEGRGGGGDTDARAGVWYINQGSRVSQGVSLSFRLLSQSHDIDDFKSNSAASSSTSANPAANNDRKFTIQFNRLIDLNIKTRNDSICFNCPFYDSVYNAMQQAIAMVLMLVVAMATLIGSAPAPAPASSPTSFGNRQSAAGAVQSDAMYHWIAMNRMAQQQQQQQRWSNMFNRGSGGVILSKPQPLIPYVTCLPCTANGQPIISFWPPSSSAIDPLWAWLHSLGPFTAWWWPSAQQQASSSSSPSSWPYLSTKPCCPGPNPVTTTTTTTASPLNVTTTTTPPPDVLTTPGEPQ